MSFGGGLLGHPSLAAPHTLSAVIPLPPMPLPALSSKTERLRGAASMAECHHGSAQATVHQRGAYSVAGHRRGAAYVQACRWCATSRAVSHRGATKRALPNVAPAQWRGTTVVLPTRE